MLINGYVKTLKLEEKPKREEKLGIKATVIEQPLSSRASNC